MKVFALVLTLKEIRKVTWKLPILMLLSIKGCMSAALELVQGARF